jgi:ferrous iron transport protein A
MTSSTTDMNADQHHHSLGDIASGNRAAVRALRGGKDFISRMTALGFTIGSEVKVIQNYGHGPLIALIRDTRVALGRGEAIKVLVEELTADA